MRQDFSTITAETVSRSKLLIVVYYDFLSKMKNEQDEEFRSFRNIYEAFKLEANRYLEECCYQSFSERNLFDVLLAFSAYTYVKF